MRALWGQLGLRRPVWQLERGERCKIEHREHGVACVGIAMGEPALHFWGADTNRHLMGDTHCCNGLEFLSPPSDGLQW